MSDSLQSLRKLGKQFNIRHRREEEEWPESHKKTFQNIKTLGKYRFNTYIQGVSVLSDDEPWKQQTKARAQWLVNRAERLFGQERNEAGWRFGLENDVLRRFTVEVACPRCRARVWQSEIQATWNHDNDDYAQHLEERRRRRQPCHCPPDERPKDFYEIGTNSLFDDRADEFVLYDDVVKSKLPKQGPDRVFGLQNTRNFDILLSSPVRPDIQKSPEDTIADVLKTTPFKTQADPLLFPFLVLEAKSEVSSRGFEAILVQSSFPIRALLQMQEDLRSQSEGEGVFDPLVWFLASRGDAWKVWCGHVTKGENGEPTKYETTLLWSGSLLHRDDALQLVLIVDYIMDWARDIYRIAILKQLKSMVRGQPYDQISLADSNMFSMRGDVTNWIPAPPSTVFGDFAVPSLPMNDKDDPRSMPFDHQTLLDIRIPNTKLGSLRSASRSDFRFTCLYLTESLLPSFLQVISGRHHNTENTEKAARHIINFVTQFDEVLVMSKDDLDLLELLWTDAIISSNPNENSQEFYVVMEAGWYFSPSWEITREISCLAITKSAFNILKTYAKFQVRHKGIESLPKCERRCTSSVIRQCVECLRFGSPWQNLLSTISCTFVTIYPLPARMREDFTPPVDVLGLGYARYSRVRPFVTKYLKRNLWKPKKYTTVETQELRKLMKKGYTKQQVFDMKSERPPKHTDTSWKRISEQRSITLEEEFHTHESCGRCAISPETNVSPFAHGFLDTRNVPLLSDYNAVLVVSLQKLNYGSKPDSCVFSLGKMHKLENDAGLSVMIEDLLQLGLIYHTLKYTVDDLSSSSDLRSNLPLPYRSATNEERFRLENWIRELRGEPISEPKGGNDRGSAEWTYTCMLMYLLTIGHLEQEATALLTIFGSNYDHMVYTIEKENHGESSPFFKKAKLCGELLIEPFSSWVDGKQYLRREYPKQISYIESISGGMSSSTTDE